MYHQGQEANLWSVSSSTIYYLCDSNYNNLFKHQQIGVIICK